MPQEPKVKATLASGASREIRESVLQTLLQARSSVRSAVAGLDAVIPYINSDRLESATRMLDIYERDILNTYRDLTANED
jgi:hypothetical protein